MSSKMLCPGCNSYTSNVFADVEMGVPCRNCGLPADSIQQINDIRVSRATDAVRQQAEEAIMRAEKAEAALRTFERLRDALIAAGWTAP